MNPIKSTADIDRLLAEPVAILLKHSTRCPISARALGEVSELNEEHPGTPIYVLDVNAQSRLSAQVAECFGVAHDSPQAFVVRNGQPAWSATHHAITARELAQQVGEN
ncbi:MAG TPA: bacillithiol system redox-active protein YtxJ [Gemmatimonadaceae bacterium]|nr:bacillithiol system redox-active protein YtxJ [Gemmatimonadaceae bacterium]